jgi:tetratricopeptide (TPR) repeat protein
LLAMQRRSDEALPLIEQLLASADPVYSVEAIRLAGLLHAQRGDYEKASRMFREHLRVAPDSPLRPHLEAQLRDWEMRAQRSSR